VNSAAEHDRVVLQRAAHTLRGSADALSATRVAWTARQLETAARDHDLSVVEPLIDELVDELSRLSTALTEFAETCEPAARCATRVGG
jgi:HPt (histidine-containing phosphotransfer) domain-containing protein